ncbi:hypothetical protein [Streptomyces sp. IMTB 2501]|uniref:hypothetical protein n=1 Tax=Streptomyces sp. IMTB 2501 TaxID=1776340 RepID=UPI0015C07CB2|nr:hypothetical protein [Streptomyces sp. IMTB 2501]
MHGRCAPLPDGADTEQRAQWEERETTPQFKPAPETKDTQLFATTPVLALLGN